MGVLPQLGVRVPPRLGVAHWQMACPAQEISEGVAVRGLAVVMESPYDIWSGRQVAKCKTAAGRDGAGNRRVFRRTDLRQCMGVAWVGGGCVWGPESHGPDAEGSRAECEGGYPAR